MNTQHDIKIDLHEAKQSIENICIIGASCNELRKTDQVLEQRLADLNAFLQKIWKEVMAKHTQQIDDDLRQGESVLQ